MRSRRVMSALSILACGQTDKLIFGPDAGSSSHCKRAATGLDPCSRPQPAGCREALSNIWRRVVFQPGPGCWSLMMEALTALPKCSERTFRGFTLLMVMAASGGLVPSGAECRRLFPLGLSACAG